MNWPVFWAVLGGFVALCLYIRAAIWIADWVDDHIGFGGVLVGFTLTLAVPLAALIASLIETSP